MSINTRKHSLYSGETFVLKTAKNLLTLKKIGFWLRICHREAMKQLEASQFSTLILLSIYKKKEYKEALGSIFGESNNLKVVAIYMESLASVYHAKNQDWVLTRKTCLTSRDITVNCK